jgi:hypothetical protein
MRNLIDIGSKYLKAGDSQKRELISYYNENCVSLVKPSRRYSMKFEDNWCAMFTSVVAHKAGLESGQFPFEVSVFEQVKIAREWGTFSTDLGKVTEGDLIIYDWFTDGTLDHVGIVAEVEGDYLKVLEGNYKNTVAFRFLKRLSPAIHGVIAIEAATPASGQRIKTLVKKVLQGHYGDGWERKRLLGDDYEMVQNEVNKILK